MIKNLTDLELRARVIAVGGDLEAVDYNRKFQGYPNQPGLSKESLDKERRNLRAKAKRLMAEMYERKIETSEDEELEYALQFI